MQHESGDANQVLMQFLYQAPVGLVQTTLDGKIEMLNPMAANLLIPLATDARLDNLFDVLAPVAPQLPALIEAFMEPAGMICEGLRLPATVQYAVSEPPRVLSLNLTKLDAVSLIATVADVTVEFQREQARLSRRLHSAARIDSLTRMPNREAVREELQRLLARAQDGQGFAVLILNCDRFRQLNDSLGQAGGDQLLRHMADRLRGALFQPTHLTESTARSGNLAARIGSDEFVVVLDGLRTCDDAERVALYLLDALDHPYVIGSHEIVCSVSLGLVWGPDAVALGAHDPDSLLRDASIAMAEAKSAGGNRHAVFELGMRERAVRRADIEADLRQALAEEQLFVVYQPVVRLLPDGGIDRAAGVEALVRWRHPQRGIVPPIEFIQVAEECGLIGALGDFVLQRACHDFMDWQTRLRDAAPRFVAVNLSRAQLGQVGWIDSVGRMLGATGVPPASLQLEVTESLAAQCHCTQERLHELKALGIKLALDDFGTGYSSLSSLHLLPVDTVKIDRSFVSQADTSFHHRVLIEATVKVAQSLGMKTVAEGIETRAQLDVVREMRCDKVQGYYFSRPLPTLELMDWLVLETATA